MPTYLSEWDWIDQSATDPDAIPHWRPPGDNDELRDSLDLRSLAQAGAAGFTSLASGFGLFTYNRAQPGMPLELPVRPETNLSNLQKSGLKSLLGLAQDYVVQDRWGDALFEILTSQSDPTGENRWKPIRPNALGELTAQHGGRVFHAEQFDPESPAGMKVREVFQADYRRAVAQLEAMPSSEADRTFEGLGRYLGAAMGRYRLPKEMLLPQEYANHPARQPHTTISDNFNRADAASLGTAAGGWSWVDMNGDWQLTNNAAEDHGLLSTARADSDLSSDDHYCQVNVIQVDGTGSGTQTRGGVLVRKQSGNNTETYYHVQLSAFNSAFTCFRVVSGAFTAIGGNKTVSVSLPQAMKLQADGSSIKTWWDGVLQHDTTDTQITGFLQCGIRNDDAGTPANQLRLDDFVAEDVVVGGGGVSIPVVQQHRRLIGVL